MKKKKIVIFTVASGGGHTAATQALTEYLGSTYEIIPIDFITEVLHLYIIPKYYSFNDVYNFLLKKNWITFVNISKGIVWAFFKMIKPLAARLIKKAILRHSPDCIISVIPLGNNATLAVAKDLNIPFFIIPTDYDPRTYFYHVSNVNYDKFYIARVIDDPKINSYILKTGVRRENVLDTGFVLRRDFFTSKDPAALKQKFNIPQNVPVIMVMLGAAGSDNSYKIARELHKLNTRCHFIFCAGRDEGARKKISALRLPPHITMTVLGFTKEVADLLATADIFVTKPGPNSVAEGIQMKVPLVLATFGRTLTWETFDIGYVIKNSYGVKADTVNDIYRELKLLLESPNTLKNIKHHLEIRKNIDLEKNLQDALAHILK
jgi:processive 1,2-diacylglycerol beta-glucosyltransferase